MFNEQLQQIDKINEYVGRILKLIELQVDKMLNEENEKFKTEQLQSYKRDIEAETVVTDETIAVEVH